MGLNPMKRICRIVELKYLKTLVLEVQGNKISNFLLIVYN